MRRIALLLLVVSSILAAGCVGTDSNPTRTQTDTVTTTTPNGTQSPSTVAEVTEVTPQVTTTGTSTYAGDGSSVLRAQVVDHAPENATVLNYTESSPPLPVIEQALDEALAADDGFSSVDLSTSMVSTAQDELAPAYNESSDFGYYVRYQNETFRLRLVQYG